MTISRNLWESLGKLWEFMGISGNLWELRNLGKRNRSVHQELYKNGQNLGNSKEKKDINSIHISKRAKKSF